MLTGVCLCTSCLLTKSFKATWVNNTRDKENKAVDLREVYNVTHGYNDVDKEVLRAKQNIN